MNKKLTLEEIAAARALLLFLKQPIPIDDESDFDWPQFERDRQHWIDLLEKILKEAT